MDDAATLTLVEHFLAPGETLLWRQVAPVGPLLTLSAVGAAFIAAITAGLVLLTRKALRRGPLATRIMLGVALALLVGGELVSIEGIFAARSTVYAVTDSRVMIISRDPALRESSYGPADIQSLRRDGDTLSFSYGESPHAGAVTLWGLNDAQAVEALIREIAPDA